MHQKANASSPQYRSLPSIEQGEAGDRSSLGPTSLDAARAYAARGYAVIPVPHRAKNPGFKGWQQMRLGEADLPHHFNGHPQNLGVLLGEPSGWLVDVDLDHARCVALADEYLPPTEAVFGRAGKARSHRLYRVTQPVTTKKHKSKSAGMLVELRSTGMQTVFPPSTHESGEAIEWEAGGAEPAEVDPDELLAAVEALATAVKVELGEKAPPKAKKATKSATADEAERAEGELKPKRSTVRINDKIRACVAAMLRLKLVDQNDGSSRLFAAACRVVEHDLTDDQGLEAIRQYARQRPFPTEWSDEQILQRIRDAEGKAERGVIRREQEEGGKRRVVIDPDEHRVVCETVEALSADDGIFHRGGVLVRVLREHSDNAEAVQRSSGTAAISFLPQAALRERMTRHIEFTQFVKRGDGVEEVLAHPTQWLVAAVDARGEWPGIRHLKGVSDVPVLRADGTIWQTPGYDEQTGVLYEPSEEFPVVPDEVDLNDADAAVAELLEVVCDFRFESDDHRAAWLAGLLTPLARFAFDGPTPLFLIDANVRGAGKGLLAQTIGQIVLGREMPVSSYAHDTEEMRKKITAIALAGDRMIHLDNLEGSFGNDTLDRALTATRWKDRILGKSQEVDLPLIPVWYGTGNNVSVAADTTRRIIHIRLDVLQENPEERTGFRHPELIGWLRQNRPRLLTCALTILRAYCNAGMPRQDVSAFGSFEGWSRLVREAIVWVGQPDPCETRAKLAEQSDTVADSLGQLIAAWPEIDPHDNGIVVSELLSRLYSKEYPPRDDAASIAMRAALETLVGCPPGRAPTPRQVGAKLKTFRRRVVGGCFIDSDPNEPRRNGAVWRLHHA